MEIMERDLLDKLLARAEQLLKEKCVRQPTKMPPPCPCCLRPVEFKTHSQLLKPLDPACSSPSAFKAQEKSNVMWAAATLQQLGHRAPIAIFSVCAADILNNGMAHFKPQVWPSSSRNRQLFRKVHFPCWRGFVCSTPAWRQ